ncbi:MAG: hypothetical protein ACT4PV_10505 [Planctomycetaceae bacterium]
MKSAMNRVLLLGALACALSVAPTASAGGWFKEMDESKVVPLGDVLRNPHDFVDVPIRLEVYFNAPGRSFNPYYTRFSEDLYANFSAWPVNARLWEKRDFQRSYGLFFVLSEGKVWKKLAKTQRVASLELSVVVRDVFKGQPWIEVVGFETRGEGITEAQVRDVIAGDALFLAGRHGEAAKKYDRALSGDLPASTKAEITRKLADAHYGAGRHRQALDAYRAGRKLVPGSAVFQQGEEACRQAMAAASAKSRGREAGEVTILPAGRDQEVFADGVNDVDAMIALFEDPDAVAAEVARDRQELLDRATALRAAAVADEVEEPVPAVAPTEEAPTGGSEQSPVTEEPAPAEPVVPAEEQGCGSADEEIEPWSDEVEESGTEGEGVEGCGAAAEGCAPVEEGCAPAEEGCAPAAEGCASVEEGCAPAEEGCAPAAEGCAPVEEGCAPAEEGCAPAAEGCASVEEGCGEAVPACGSEGMEEGMEGCGSDEAPAQEQAGCETAEVVDEPANEMASADPIPVPSDPRVVTVAGQEQRLPRLPFSGCEAVTLDQLRAILEEILSNPEF